MNRMYYAFALLIAIATPGGIFAEELQIGAIAPEFSAESIDGKETSLKNYRGRYVIVKFGASWCGPSRADATTLKKLHSELPSMRFAVIGLLLDDDIAAVKRHRETTGVTWRQCLVGSSGDHPAVKAYRVKVLPTILLIGPEGEILAQGMRGEEIRKAVEKHLKID